MNRLRMPLGVLLLSLLLFGEARGQPYFDDHAGLEEISPDTPAHEPRFDTDIDTVDRAHQAYLTDSELQLQRPESDLDEPPPVTRQRLPDWLRALGDFLNALGPVFRVIFWIAVVLVVGGLLYFLFGEAIRLRFGGDRKPKQKQTDDVLLDLRPDAEAARSLLEEADALARQGRFAEAVHLLLFRSIEDIQERIDGGVPTSLTAREIASLSKLPERAKRGLKPIIQVVERSFFGGRAVNAEGWQEARRSYEDFAFGEGWA